MREIRASSPPGYLPPDALPNSVALLPQPPAPGSAAFALDEEISKQCLALHGTGRWTLAKEDADLTFPQAAGIFSCALDAPVTEQDTPRLYVLLRRSLSDVARATHVAKDRYKRVRPFVINKRPICAPDEEKEMAESGSYPSSHAAVGWAWALILAEISPGQTDAILARGRTYGESRVVCNEHWQSDVTEAAFIGAGTVARLHADKAFLADLEAAKGELAAVRLKGLRPLRDCAWEAANQATLKQ